MPRKALAALDIATSAAISVIPEKTVYRQLGSLQLIRRDYGEGASRVWLVVPEVDSDFRYELRPPQVDWIVEKLMKFCTTGGGLRNQTSHEEMRFTDGSSLIFEVVETADAAGMLRCRFVAFNGQQQTAYPTRTEVEAIIRDIAADPSEKS
ncbi:MAG: hypothetical protein KDJ25_06405 [Rhodoblastus sp.]|nr:hypothetical protein [Rhodoblastus sp.]